MKLKAKAINSGIAFANTFNLISDNTKSTSFIGVESSIKQFEKVIENSIKQLTEIKQSNLESNDFIDAHILILNDAILKEEVVSLITNQHLNALDAFVCVIDKYIKIMQSSNDTYLNERYLDFLDIKSRVLQNFNKQMFTLSNLEECILLVEELYPSLVLNISKNVKGIIAKKGGLTSHSAILCKNLGIPYVVVDFPLDYKGEVIIDHDNVIFNPSLEMIEYYKNLTVEEEKIVKDLKDIKVWANVVNNIDVANISEDFSGIGLYRTEFILMNPECAFNIDLQTYVYKKALELMKGKIVTFRTFDIGDDKTIDYLPLSTKGVINYYIYPKLFENQIISILNASKSYPNQVKIMFPMIENIKQFQELKKIVVKLARELKIKVPPIGMMLETQGALINLEDFQNVDFISVGTNDLCSELFNISREEVVLYDNLYDDLLSLLDRIIKFSNRNNIEVSVCGELINKTEFAKKAIALGLKNISINNSSINNIYKAINEE